MRFSSTILAFALLACGCRKDNSTSNQVSILIVSISNVTEKSVTYNIKFNDTLEESLTLSPKQKFVVYDCLSDQTNSSIRKVVSASIKSTDGSKFSFKGFNIDLQSVVGVEGNITSQGASGAPLNNIPPQYLQWSPRLIKNLSAVEVIILP